MSLRDLRLGLVASVLLVPVTITGCREDQAALPDGLYAEFETDRGVIVVELYYERVPLTVMNFVGLSEGSLDFAEPSGRFYDGLVFHRVVEDFMIQGGDPTATGRGGPGYKFPDEIDPALLFEGPGVLAMANAGPDTNGSQFFITHTATPWLQGRHTVFGQVIEGQDVVDSIVQGDSIKKVIILRRGEKAEAFEADEQDFRALTREVLEKKEQDAKEARKTMIEKITARWPDAKTSDSGIFYVIKNEGVGPPPSKGNQITVHYTGSLMDGTQFDSSREGEPFSFKVGVGQVIAGWDEMLGGMKMGERRVIILPPEAAYGSQAVGPIPANSWLVFDVELLDYQESDS